MRTKPKILLTIEEIEQDLAKNFPKILIKKEYPGYEYAAWLEERSNFLAEQKLKTQDSRNVGTLWIGFLEYYTKYDWDNLVVDIYSNKIMAREKKTSKWFIKDPFENRNLAEMSTSMSFKIL